MPPATRNEFRSDLGLVAQAVRSGVVSSRARAADKQWDRWVDFCQEQGWDPWLYEFEAPVPILQVFAARYRDGRIAPSGNPVRSRTVEDALRSVGQTFASMGSQDIRKNQVGGIDFRIQRQLKSYAKADPPPDRVKPIPIPIIFHCLAAAFGATGSLALQAIADMIVLAFFFLLRPGEYTGTPSDTTPFRRRSGFAWNQQQQLSKITRPRAFLAANIASGGQ